MIQVGTKAPDFSVQDHDGNTVSLSDFAGKKVVVFFYPKANTPGCTLEACDLRDHYSELTDAGYSILGVSADTVSAQAKFAMKFSFVTMTLDDLLLSMFGGIIAGLGISSIVYGSRMLPASIYGMTSYFQLIYGVVLGWLVFQQLPTTFNYIGIIFVFSAGIILFTFDKNKS